MAKAKFAIRFRQLREDEDDSDWSFMDDLFDTENEAKAKVRELVEQDTADRETFEYSIFAAAEVLRHKRTVTHKWERV